MHKKLIFGSTAARHWFSSFRTPKDLDYMVENDNTMDREVQAYWFPGFSYILENNKDSIHVDPEFLFTIKAAHLKFLAHWDKTANDVLFFQSKGLKINKELYKILLKDFTAHYGKRWASLKDKNAQTFFEDKVDRKYIHDTLHDAVAYYEKPLYEKILKGDGTVNCSKEKFDALPFEDKVRLVKEEVFVTALERFLIPNDFKYSVNRAYWLSLKKLATTMSSGWFSYFITENFLTLSKNSDDYVTKFHNGLKNNIIKLN